MFAVRGAARAWLLLCACSACGDEEPSEPYPIGMIDGGMMDAALPPVDASMDASSPPDAGDAGGPSCSTGSLDIATVTETFLNPLEPLALSLRNEGASLGWVALENGKGRAFTRWFGSSGDTLDTPQVADLAKQSEPAIAATGSGFVSLSSDDVAGRLQLRARSTDTTGVLIDVEPKQLTNDAEDNRAPVLATGADGNVVALWTARSPSTRAKTMLLDQAGNALGVAHDIPEVGALLGRAALSPMGAGYLLAWVDAAGRRVHVQRLDKAGLPVGASSQDDAEGGARGNLDLAFTDQGGALVFDVLVDGARPEVRVRTFDLSGVATSSEQNLTRYPDTGMRPSLVALRGGYVLAYRSAQAPEQQLRLALLDGRGAPITAAKVTTLTSLDLPLVMRASPDGEEVFLSWLDQLPESNGYQLQRTWIHCD